MSQVGLTPTSLSSLVQAECRTSHGPFGTVAVATWSDEEWLRVESHQRFVLAAWSAGLAAREALGYLDGQRRRQDGERFYIDTYDECLELDAEDPLPVDLFETADRVSLIRFESEVETLVWERMPSPGEGAAAGSHPLVRIAVLATTLEWRRVRHLLRDTAPPLIAASLSETMHPPLTRVAGTAESAGQRPSGPNFAVSTEGERRRLVTAVHLILGEDPSVADRIVQEAFVVLFRRGQSAEPPQVAPADLARIAINETLKQTSMRDQQRAPQNAIAGEGVADEPSSPTNADALSTIRSLVQALPVEQRIAVVLRYYSDWTPEAIGEALGVPPVAVRARLHRALKSLKRQLSQRPGLLDEAANWADTSADMPRPVREAAEAGPAEYLFLQAVLAS